MNPGQSQKNSYTLPQLLTKLKIVSFLCPLYFETTTEFVHLAHFLTESSKQKTPQKSLYFLKSFSHTLEWMLTKHKKVLTLFDNSKWMLIKLQNKKNFLCPLILFDGC